MTTMNIPSEPALPRSWWSRNWKWLVPVGIIVPLLLCGTCVVGLVTVVFSALRSSEVAKHAVSQAQADSRVTSLLGQPIEMGYFVAGTLNVTGSTGQADMSIPISGPKGKAKIKAQATRSGGVWNYTKLDVTPSDGGPPIDVLKSSSSP